MVTVEFENDPTFAGGTARRTQTFYLTALPRRRPRSPLENLTGVFSSAFRTSLSFVGFGKPPISAHDSTAAGTDETFDLREDEVEEQDRGEDGEIDDHPALDRAVRVIGVTSKEEEQREFSDNAWVRRQWEVLPLRTTPARNSTQSPFLVKFV